MRIEYTVTNKFLKSDVCKNLTDNSFSATYGIDGVVKNQTLHGTAIHKKDYLYILWDIGGCSMIPYSKALDMGFIIKD